MLKKAPLLILLLLLASCECSKCREDSSLPESIIRAQRVIKHYTPVGTSLIGVIERGKGSGVPAVLVAIESSCFLILNRNDRRMVPIDCPSAHALVEKHGIAYKAESPR